MREVSHNLQKQVDGTHCRKVSEGKHAQKTRLSAGTVTDDNQLPISPRSAPPFHCVFRPRYAAEGGRSPKRREAIFGNSSRHGAPQPREAMG